MTDDSRLLPSNLRTALSDLIRAYVRLLESGRDRIVSLGGQCDPVDVMERGDPYLRKAKEALSANGSAVETGAGVKCTHCNGKGETESFYNEERGWQNDGPCATCNGIGRIRTVEQYLKTLPANWHEDSSLETWFPLSAEEHARYKQALYRANGFLIMHGLEPVKLEYARPSVEEPGNYPSDEFSPTCGPDPSQNGGMDGV